MQNITLFYYDLFVSKNACNIRLHFIIKILSALILLTLNRKFRVKSRKIETEYEFIDFLYRKWSVHRCSIIFPFSQSTLCENKISSIEINVGTLSKQNVTKYQNKC